MPRTLLIEGNAWLRVGKADLASSPTRTPENVYPASWTPQLLSNLFSSCLLTCFLTIHDLYNNHCRDPLLSEPSRSSVYLMKDIERHATCRACVAHTRSLNPTSSHPMSHEYTQAGAPPVRSGTRLRELCYVPHAKVEDDKIASKITAGDLSQHSADLACGSA